MRVLRLILATFAIVTVVPVAAVNAEFSPVYRIDHLTDGDTVVLRNGQRVRLIQIDTPEVYFGTEVLRKAGVRSDEASTPTGHPSAPVR